MTRNKKEILSYWINGYSVEEISKKTGLPVEKIKKIIGLEGLENE